MEARTKAQILKKREEGDADRVIRFAKEDAILAALPEDFKGDISSYSAYCDGAVWIGIEGRAGVLELIEKYPPIPCVTVRDGCFSIQPEGTIPARVLERGTAEIADMNYPVTWQFDGTGADIYGHHKTEQFVAFRWYTKLAGGAGPCVDFSAHVNGDTAILKSNHTRDRSGHVTAYRWDFFPYFEKAKRIVKYAGGGPASAGSWVYAWDELADLAQDVSRAKS